MKQLKGIFFHWLPLALTIVGFTGLIYVAVQQNYRQSLNDPQIQIVRDMASALENGKQPVEVVPRDIIDANKSLSVFMAVFDHEGNPLEASAIVDDLPPKPPIGVFEHAKAVGEHRVTWQPNPDTRIALVIRPVLTDRGWFVAAGRNMSEVESRIERLNQRLGSGLIIILLATFACELIGDFWRRRTMKFGKS